MPNESKDIASGTTGPIDLARVLYEECRLLHPLFPPDASLLSQDEPLERIIGHIHDCPERAALCLSGGGIRSATFSLGVLQGLAHHGLLERFTYLSTVSGGGYIGSWLSAWILRSGNGTRTVQQKLVEAVERRGDEPEPVAMLRAYSNYLTPRLGLLSADTWTLVATVLRNLVLNWLILVPVVAMALLVPPLLRNVVELPWSAFAPLVLLVVGSLLALMPIAYVDADLPSSSNRRWPQGRFLRFSLAPLVAASASLATAWALYSPGEDGIPLVGFVVYGAVVHLAGWAVGRVLFRGKGPDGADARRPPRVLEFLAIAGVGAAGGWALWMLAPPTVGEDNVDAYLVLAAPALLALFLLATTVYVGLASRWTTDEDREWWARAAGWVLVACLAWVVTMAAGLYGPWIFEQLWQRGGHALRAYVATTGVSGIVTWIAGRSAKTPRASDGKAAPDARGRALQWALAIAAPLFVISLVLLIAFSAEQLFQAVHRHLAGWFGLGVAIDRGIFVLLLGAVAGVASFTVNVNRFSLHAMYRNRLIRAYLGAARTGGATPRQPNPFTGFDENDNVHMHELTGVRPFHVVNVALNLVRGRRLAWQHRKAAAFSVSPLHCGTAAEGPDGGAIGYQPSATYGGGLANRTAAGITLGTAMAISGAAVSPNMGYHSSPIVGLLLTAFNGRLGWWLANTGKAGRGRWSFDGPGVALRPLFAEAFGLTDDENPYVYLSDGGHFENLALYEMIRRRCRTIVVVDAGCDPGRRFEDLGNALRKIRIDLGVEIEWEGDVPGTSTTCRLYKAAIRYSRSDGIAPERDGRLVLLKPTVHDDDPVDIGTYKRLHDAFPHESTGDQWFDEEQFESYRRLGLVTSEQAIADVRTAFDQGVWPRPVERA
jgi:hypothetical protein